MKSFVNFMKKWISRIFLSFIILIGVALIGSSFFYFNSYQALDEQFKAMAEVDMSGITYYTDNDQISFTVENPKKNIVFVPGGLVQPDAYNYLALGLAKEGYDVTISKALFNLAIYTPNRATKFLRSDLENVVIGHSLGGVTGSIFSSSNDLVNEVIFLGSYPIQDLSDKEVHIILAEHDIAMNMESLNDSLENISTEDVIYTIEGGNHAQFGWYGEQRGDGTAEIPTLTQQQITISKIVEYIE